MGMASEVLEMGRLLRNRHLSPPDLRALQERKLHAVIRHTYEKVPYYGDLFRSAGIAPADIRTIEDLKYVPVTRKEDLRAAGLGRIIATGVDLSSCHRTRTSGSTGKPFDVYRSHRECRTARLLGFRSLLAMGFRPWDRFCGFHREPAPPARLHQRLGLYRREWVSPFITMEEQVRSLRRIQPTVLYTRPMFLRALLHPVDYRIREIVRPRILISTGEVFDEGLKNRIQADIEVEVFDAYGATEFGEIAVECRAHEGLHVSADQVILECLQDSGQPADPGTPGVTVLTSLYSFTMPFIRYRLGDICTWLDRPCPCGSPFPLIGPPLGKQEDIVRLPGGKVLSPAALVEPTVGEVDGISAYRLTQEDYDRFVLQIVPYQDLREETLSQMRAGLLERLGEPVKLDIQIVDSIPEEKLKFRRFVSKLPQSG